MTQFRNLNNTDRRIIAYLKQGCSDERIAARLGRPMSLELEQRIQKLRDVSLKRL